MVLQKHTDSVARRDALTIPELEQSKAAVLSTLASVHSRRSYAYAIERFIAWYCSEPRLTFNRSVVVRYRSHLESLDLSASTINLHLSAIRRLADESAESGWLSPELAIGIRRVKGVKRLGRKSGNWLTRNQAQELVNAASKTDLRGWRDGAILGLTSWVWLRRSEVVGLTLDQLQMQGGHTGSLSIWSAREDGCEQCRCRRGPRNLLDAWLSHSGVSEGKVFRRVSESRKATRGWRYSERGLVCGEAMCPAGRHTTIWRRTTFVALAPDSAMIAAANSNRFGFCLGHASVQTTERYIGSKQKLQDAVNDRFRNLSRKRQSPKERCGRRTACEVGDSVLYHRVLVEAHCGL